ncbi:hypothetical protein Tco_0337487 [Tanacetum coccineum]
MCLQSELEKEKVINVHMIKKQMSLAFNKNFVPSKTRSLTVADNIMEEPVAVELAKSISIEEQRHQQLPS